MEDDRLARRIPEGKQIAGWPVASSAVLRGISLLAEYGHIHAAWHLQAPFCTLPEKIFDLMDVSGFFYTMSIKPIIKSAGDQITNTSFEEKSVWIQLVSVLAMMGIYAFVAGHMLANGVDDLRAYVPLFGVAVVLLVVLLVVGHAAAAIFGRADGRDERDRLIGWRSESNGSWVMGMGVLTAITGMIFALPNAWIAHWLLLVLFLSELVNLVSQLFYYRRGF